MAVRRRRATGKRRPYDLSKGIYLLPNLFTSGSVLFGFWSMIASSQGDWVRAAWYILVCHVFDGLDGRIARMTHTTSRFGVEYDSLADVVSFGVAPSFLVYHWALVGYGRWGWLVAFLFLAAGAVRLARFNVQAGTTERGRFVGLPIPAAASVVATTILLYHYLAIEGGEIRPALLVFLLTALSALMVSTVPYRSLKDLGLRSRIPLPVLFVVFLVVIVMVAEPQWTFFVVFLGYALSGPVEWALTRHRRGAAAPPVPGERALSVIEGRRAERSGGEGKGGS